jgi:hypothetical protein
MPGNVPVSAAASPAKPPVKRVAKRRVTMAVAANKAATPEKPAAAPARSLVSPPKRAVPSGTNSKPALIRPAVR